MPKNLFEQYEDKFGIGPPVSGLTEGAATRAIRAALKSGKPIDDIPLSDDVYT